MVAPSIKRKRVAMEKAKRAAEKELQQSVPVQPQPKKAPVRGGGGKKAPTPATAPKKGLRDKIKW